MRTLLSVIVAMVMLAAQTAAAAVLVVAPWKLVRVLRGGAGDHRGDRFRGRVARLRG